MPFGIWGDFHTALLQPNSSLPGWLSWEAGTSAKLLEKATGKKRLRQSNHDQKEPDTGMRMSVKFSSQRGGLGCSLLSLANGYGGLWNRQILRNANTFLKTLISFKNKDNTYFFFLQQIYISQSRLNYGDQNPNPFCAPLSVGCVLKEIPMNFHTYKRRS